jgi:hypothetical protein
MDSVAPMMVTSSRRVAHLLAFGISRARIYLPASEAGVSSGRMGGLWEEGDRNRGTDGTFPFQARNGDTRETQI